MGDLKKALEYGERCLEMEQRIYGDEHPEVASSLSGIGGVYQEMGDLKKALEYGERCLEMEQRIYGDEHPEVATTLSVIGKIQQLRGEFDEALRLRQAARDIRIRIYGNAHGRVAMSHLRLAELHEAREDAAAERASYEACLAARTDDRSNDDVNRARVGYAACLLRQGEPALAAEQARLAIEELDADSDAEAIAKATEILSGAQA
jgi:tetratricopeptide (TPR) repeat protein